MQYIVLIRRLALFLILTSAGTVRAATDALPASVSTVLQKHCTSCHGIDKPEANLNLSGSRSLDQLAAESDSWFRVLEQIESRRMPPREESQPTDVERRAVVDWIRGELAESLRAKQQREGRSKLRRLSRAEYANTIEDLFGVRPTIGVSLPEDGRVDGYDKVSAALPMSASGAAGYLKMAEEVLRWTLRPLPAAAAQTPEESTAARTVRALAVESGQSAGHSLILPDGAIVSFNSDTTSGRLKYPGCRTPGRHKLRISVYAYQTDRPIPFGIYAGHTSAYPQILDLLQVLEAPPGKPTVLETEVYLRTRDLNDRTPVSDGLRLIPFGLGVQVPKSAQASECRGPGLAVQWVDVEEPELPLLVDRWLTADFPTAMNEELRRNKKAFISNVKKPYQAKSIGRDEFLAVMEKTFRRVGAQLYRRDLTPMELKEITDEISRRIDAEETLEKVFIDQLVALMTAPDFLCLIEEPGPLSDFALASRLSYFLWNSAPDETLLDLARNGTLRDPQVLRQQTERLLDDPKSNRFTKDFVNQWLGLRAIDDTSPDGKLYPEYAENDLLKPSSVWETQAFFRQLVEKNLGVRHLVASPWVLVNESLAKHYGLADVRGLELRQVKLPASSPFGGLWTQAAVMKVTANGTNTSPVKRGVWVAERLLGIRIPPPPPNINPVEPDIRGAKTLREQLALHRGSGACASCHAKFDPYGFALESFDVTGGFRKHYREPNPEVVSLPVAQRGSRPVWREGLPVDASGETPDGRTFADVAELRQILSDNPQQLAHGVARHLITYATGMPPAGADRLVLERIVNEAAGNEYGVRSLIHAVVQSELFRTK
jgi:mono/diheme cytochrome c family protein